MFKPAATALLLASIFALGGCGASYGNMGIWGGVEHTKLTEDTYAIRAKVSSVNDATTVDDFILLRAAEVTLADGRPYFVITKTEDLSQVYTNYVPGSVQQNYDRETYRDGNGKGYSTTATTYYTPPYEVSSVVPQRRVMIKTLMDKKGVPGMVYEAAQIKGSLGPRYLN
ncbi:MAG: hypothetical protein WDO70_05705 [Alphaproteobacteria bacterium]